MRGPLRQDQGLLEAQTYAPRVSVNLSGYLTAVAAAALYQPVDSDLTAIAALSPSNDDIIQRKAGAWTNRTMAQLKVDLSLSGTNTGDQTSIVGITGTKAQFDTACSDGDFGYTGAANTWSLEQTDTAIALPSAPSAGLLTRSVKSLAGRPSPFVTGPSGVARCLEYYEATGRKGEYRPYASAAGTYLGTQGSNGGTAAAVAATLTNKYTAQNRSTFSSLVTTTNQFIGVRGANNDLFRGNAAGLGGFMFMARFGFTSIKTGCRAFVGVGVNNSNLVTGDPSAGTNMVGFGFDAADSAWTFMHNDGSGTATKETISGQATLATNNTAFDVYVFCYPNDSVVYFRMDDVIQGTTLIDSSVNTNLPVSTQGMGWICAMSNGTANTAANDAVIGIASIAIYTER